MILIGGSMLNNISGKMMIKSQNITIKFMHEFSDYKSLLIMMVNLFYSDVFVIVGQSCCWFFWGYFWLWRLCMVLNFIFLGLY